MWARLTWTFFIAIASATMVAGAANEKDCTTPSMTDETSLLQTKTTLSIDRADKSHISKSSEDVEPEHKDVPAQDVSKKLESHDQIKGNGLQDQALKTEPIPAVDLPSAANVATEQAAIKSWLLDPKTQEKGGTGFFGGNGARILWQLIYGIIYYLIFVNNIPLVVDLDNPNQQAKDDFRRDALSGSLAGGIPNCICAWLCTAPHAGRTFHMTDTCGYFPSCIAMAFCPCITLFCMHACTPLEDRLGRNKENEKTLGDFCLIGLCAAFCSCCVVANDARSLDLVYGQRTGLCGIEVV